MTTIDPRTTHRVLEVALDYARHLHELETELDLEGKPLQAGMVAWYTDQADENIKRIRADFTVA